jgi:hypothetical protein
MRGEIEASGGEINAYIGGGRVVIARVADKTYVISTIRRWMGDSPVHQIFFNRFITPEDMERIRYFPEAQIIEPSGKFRGR